MSYTRMTRDRHMLGARRNESELMNFRRDRRLVGGGTARKP